MKLYLSSYKFGDNPEKLGELASDNRRIAVISNALDFSTDVERRLRSEKEQLDQLEELGFKPEILDLRKYFAAQENLKTELEGFGAMWVLGGNVFLLRSAMNQSGLDEILKGYKDREDKREFLYAGYSAGACVLAPSLKGIDLIDDTSKVIEIYGNDVIWDGLGLIDYSIAPHYDSDHPESDRTGEVVKYFIKEQIDYKALRDGEVIIQEDHVPSRKEGLSG